MSSTLGFPEISRVNMVKEVGGLYRRSGFTSSSGVGRFTPEPLNVLTSWAKSTSEPNAYSTAGM